MRALAIITFALAVWLACYLANRQHDRRSGFTAAALLTYAAGLALSLLRSRTPSSPYDALSIGLLLLSVLLWTRGTIAFLEELPEAARRWTQAWRFGAIPLFLIACALLIGAPDAIVLNLDVRVLIALLVLGPALVLSVAVAVQLTSQHTAVWIALFLIFTIFFLSSVAIVILEPLAQLGLGLAILVGLDLCMLGVIVAAVGASQAGETMLRDFIRSFDGSLIAALLFGLPVVLAAGGIPAQPAGLLALLAIVTLAVASQALNSPWQQLLDGLSLRAVPAVQRERAQLRAAADALPRHDAELVPESLDDEAFARLTRRALSHYGNLPQLAASPLVNLSLVTVTVDATGEVDSTLARAAALRMLLGSAVDALKPTAANGFNPGDDWRFFNALYYPYIVGLKPYSRRADHSHLDPHAHAALVWFRAQVPERTLYNWQNAAAALVARHLREMDRLDDAIVKRGD